MLAAVSVDLDEIPCYAAIFGLPPPEGEVAHAVYRKALPRFEELFDRQGLRATFFAIGSDLADGAAREAIARLHAAGHEIGNHTQNHRYDFTRLPEAEIRSEIAQGARAIEAVTGERPRGFRAPGYTVNDRVFAELGALGVAYDSSVFPCPSYYGAKAVAISAIAARGRTSHSIISDPRVLRAPADPYRVGTPYYRRGAGLLELPIGVTGGTSARLPYIGTTLVLGGERAAGWLTRRILGRPLVNLELHGIDLADAEPDGLGFLQGRQQDLRRSLAEKRAALETAIWILRGAGYEFVTLAQAAERFASGSAATPS
jgi:peptidoglycan/xylan/chitin deacetylase (PgdA/CDA1 family)